MVATRAERPGDRKQERWSDGDVRMKRSKVSAMIVTAAQTDNHSCAVSSSHSSKPEKWLVIFSQKLRRLYGAFQTSTHCMSDTRGSLPALSLQQS